MIVLEMLSPATFLLIAAVPVLGLAAYFVLRSTRNTALPPPQPVEAPPALKKLLDDHVDFYHQLDDDGRARFEQMVDDFLGYVRIEGVGIGITDLERALVASSAVIPVFGFPGWRYRNLTNVILYPDTFDHEFQYEGAGRSVLGMVGTGFMNGQMVLSRAALLKGFSPASGKANTAIHEFVHLLDKADGDTDGIPEALLGHEYTVPWLKLMHREMYRIKSGKSDIDPYALTSEAEFLAVAAEYFFEKPDKLQHKHPELYDEMSRIFLQDPAAGVTSLPG